VQRAKIDEGVGRELRRGEEPGATGKPRIILAPFDDIVGRRRLPYLPDGVQIHVLGRPAKRFVAGIVAAFWRETSMLEDRFHSSGLDKVF
jgi:hypothetical protein